MRIRLYLLTVVEDEAGRVVAEGRMHLPQTQQPVETAQQVETATTASAPLSPDLPLSLSRTVPSPTVPSFPLTETDADVLSMFGTDAGKYRPQRNYAAASDDDPPHVSSAAPRAAPAFDLSRTMMTDADE